MLFIGVDLIEIWRVADAVARFGERFLRRVYTPPEIAYCAGRAPELAARLAAKEAVAKALGTGIGVNCYWCDVEVLTDGSGRPRLELRGAAQARARELGVHDWAISLSHSHQYAIAFVIALGRIADNRRQHVSRPMT